MRSTVIVTGGAAAVLLLAAPAALARDKEPQGAKAAAFQAVLDCRGIGDSARRLACYDAAAAGMSEAETKGDIVVIDRAQASAAHREAFGLKVPSLSFVTRALRAEEVDRLDGVVETARADINGRWTIGLQGGAIWRQISGDLARPPHAGSKVAIRKGSLGSFLMNIDGQPSIKVHRDE